MQRRRELFLRPQIIFGGQLGLALKWVGRSMPAFAMLEAVSGLTADGYLLPFARHEFKASFDRLI